jgi:nucleotide-binding universal stress UspA family protein
VNGDAILGSGPVVIGYDGSPAADLALAMSAALLAPRKALVVVVWEPGVAWDLMAPGIEPAPIDIRTALQIDDAVYEGARRLAERGAGIAREAGMEAEGLAVADELSVANTLVRVARDRDAAAIAVGSHGHRAIREFLLGSTTRAVLKHAPCPVVVVRDDRGQHAEDDD